MLGDSGLAAAGPMIDAGCSYDTKTKLNAQIDTYV